MALLLSIACASAPALAAVSVEGINGTNGRRLDGGATQDLAGSSLARIGDFNGDRLGDLVVGSPRSDSTGQPDAGAVFIVHGSARKLVSAAFPLRLLNGGFGGVLLRGERADDRLGGSVQGAGDVNGDGLDDVIAGAERADPIGSIDAGSAYVYFGRTAANTPSLNVSTLDGSQGFRLHGTQPGSHAGRRVRGAGDVNGDGRPDLVVCAPDFDSGSGADAGAAYVIHGRSSWPASLGLDTLDGSNGFRLDGEFAGDAACDGLAAGDFNGDGVADLAIGATGRNVGAATGAGAIYLVYGRPGVRPAVQSLGSLAAQEGFRIDGIAADDASGAALELTDLNGDGLDDLVIGTPGADPGGRVQAGTVHVLYGRGGPQTNRSLADLTAPDGFRIEGAATGDAAGFALAAAGDVDADGRLDLVIGAPGVQAARGAAYLLRGGAALASSLSTADLTGETGFAIGADPEGAALGQAVCAADFNGDGQSDLAVGSPLRSNGGLINNGIVFVLQSPPLFASGFEGD